MASSFSLGDQSKLTNQSYKNTVVSLNTSDLNGDHATDLIASWGAVLINKPADPNWSPSVTASSTQPAPGDRSVTISAVANDSDQDMLLYSWTDNGGTPIPPIPSYCFTPITFGVHTFTVTVDDQHGHTASSSVTVDFGSGTGTPPSVTIAAPTAGEIVPAGTPYTVRWTATAGSAPINGFDVQFSTDDGAHYGFVPGCSNLPASARSCLWSDPDPPTQTARVFVVARSTNGPSGSATTGRFTIRSGSGGGGGGLPIGWSQADIGAVSAAGSASVTNGVWTVKGSGADIWGTADEFHYAWVPSTGPENFFEITARVTNVENVDRWTKVGLMIRSSQAANAPQAAIFVTPSSEKGIVFQRRQTTGAASLSTTGPSITAPVWLKLILAPTAVRAYYRTGTGPWTFVGQDEIRLSDTMLLGLAVTSHKDGTLAAGTFDNVSIRSLASWDDRDIGRVGVAGSGRDDCTVQTEPPCGAVVTLTGSGADIWGTADAFHLRSNASRTTASRRACSASATPTCGRRRRDDSLTASRRRPPRDGGGFSSKGVAMISPRGGERVSPASPGRRRAEMGSARPHGITFVGEWSNDGLTWTEIGRVNVTMREFAAGGLVLTSHDNARLATATFDDIYMFRP